MLQTVPTFNFNCKDSLSYRSFPYGFDCCSHRVLTVGCVDVGRWPGVCKNEPTQRCYCVLQSVQGSWGNGKKGSGRRQHGNVDDCSAGRLGLCQQCSGERDNVIVSKFPCSLQVEERINTISVTRQVRMITCSVTHPS